ncbi:DUF4244 domain-containing protein [Tersicoccus sp. MR15.9]|uniref:DUF4244 domain-containing protein n=1 Tax=Tersicoccus mangrovi TaxID=3121635 RepID=UPI002FE5041D
MSQPALQPPLADASPGAPVPAPVEGSDGDVRLLPMDHPGARRSTLEQAPEDTGRRRRDRTDDHRVIRLDVHRARRHGGAPGSAERAAVVDASQDTNDAEPTRSRWQPRHARHGVSALFAFWRRILRGDDGMATAEYAIATLAAVGFAGLLVLILKGNEVKGLLSAIIRQALGG